MALYRLITVEGRNTDIEVRALAAGMGSWHTGAFLRRGKNIGESIDGLLSCSNRDRPLWQVVPPNNHQMSGRRKPRLAI
jgi:hypothetical protein